MLRFALTGGTGLLGRNLLFEILKQNLKNLDGITIFVFGRSRGNLSLKDRLKNIILTDGVYYLGFTPESFPEELSQKIFTVVIPVDFDLTKNDLGISLSDFEKLKREPIDYFFHIAALTDFRSGSAVEGRLKEINVEGTKRLCQLIGQLNVKEVSYISSAYACGSKTGLVQPDYINLNETFRNPYEKSKLEAEIYFRNFFKDKKNKWLVFRPSTICGRLIEQPIGATNKFDVFYAWAAFFLREKFKILKSWENIYEIPVEMPVRILCNPRSGLNIVPADYAAKVLYAVCLNNHPDVSFHLANEEETPHKFYISRMMNFLNLEGWSFVRKMPDNLNRLEIFYYKTVGEIFTPYIVIKPVKFEVSNIKNMKCLNITAENFSKLLKYAQWKIFGINKNV